MNINQAFPSNFLKSSDLNGNPVLMKMERVEIETLGQGRDAEQKPVLYFSSSSSGHIDLNKGLVLNKTNTTSISDLYGYETDEWAGKEIVLYEKEVEFQGKITPAIRIRGPKVASKSAAKPKPEPARELVDDEIPF